MYTKKATFNSPIRDKENAQKNGDKGVGKTMNFYVQKLKLSKRITSWKSKFGFSRKKFNKKVKI